MSLYGIIIRVKILQFCIFCFFFKSALFQISCNTIPISVSNLTNCVDTRCYYTQYASSSINLQTNGGTCYTFNAPIVDSTQTISYQIYVNILDFRAYYDLSSCYISDDPVLSINVNCHCPGSLFTTGFCPCSTSPTAYPNNQFCISGAAYSKGCPVGGVTTYCANVGMSAYSRYQVCKLTNPTYSIQINITDTFDNSTHLFSVNTNSLEFSDPSGRFNLSLTNIVTSSQNKVGYYSVFDTTTEQTYILDPTQCNSDIEYDPNKFGYLKIASDKSLVYKDTIKSAITVEILDCLSDVYRYTSHLPTLFTFINKNRNIYQYSDIFESVPLLKSGLLIYNGELGISYIGRDQDDNIVSGPSVYVTTQFNVSLGFGGNNTFGLHYQGDTPYIDTNCSLEIFTSKADNFFFNSQKFGIVRCPNTSYVVICSATTLLNAYNTTCYAADYSGYFPIATHYYPDRWHLVFDNMDTAIIERPLNNTYANISERAVTYYADPVITGSAIVELSYNGLSINFQTLTVRPLINSFDIQGYKALFNARSTSNNGNCFVSIYTDQLNISIISTQNIFLTTIDTNFEIGLQKVNFTGLLTLVLTCGLYNATATKEVKLINGVYIPKDYSVTAQSFNPFDFPLDLPWYIWIYKIVVLAIIATVAFLVLLKLYMIISTYIRGYMILKKANEPLLKKRTARYRVKVE